MSHVKSSPGPSGESITRIPLIKPDLPHFAQIESSLREALESGKVTNFGKYASQFEQEAGAYLGTEAVSVSSGTTGLLLTLQCLGLDPGEKVILPSFTFMATAQAVLYAGGIPVFAEIGDDLTLSLSDLEMLLMRNRDVTAVIPVHTYGLPAKVDEIRSIVDKASERRSKPIAVLYDAAHAFGAAVNGRRVGGFGSAEVFSLSVTKVLVSIEGGMISSRDSGLIQRLRRMRNYGIEANYDAHWAGLNGKMSEFHAIVGLYNLRRLDALLSGRQSKARHYMKRITDGTGFKALPCPDGVTHTFKDFTVLVPERLADRRDAVMAFLQERGIESRAYFYPPVHEQRFFRRFADRPLPRTEKLARRVLTLPFYSDITDGEMDCVIAALGEAERSLV